MPQSQHNINTPTIVAPPLSPETTPDYIAEGENLFAQGLLPEARAKFLLATEDCPGNAPAWNNLGVISLLEGDQGEAERLLRQALEVQSDYLDAYFNLTELYIQKGNLKRAAKELSRVLEFKPTDIPTLKRLAKIYLDLGQPQQAQEFLDRFEGLGAMKSFIDSLWLGIKYYAMADDLSARDKLEKLMIAVLKYLDGHDGRSPRYKLLVSDPETGQEVMLEDFFFSFYYKERPSLTILETEKSFQETCLVLTIGDHDDWIFFKEALRSEMRAEGGCLGNFIQTRKVMKREARLSKYDLEATLRYFLDNVGPCDCHVLKATLV